MFRYYTGMLCFFIKYLRISINFLLLKTILAKLNEEIELLKQFSLKLPSKLFDAKLNGNLFLVERSAYSN